MKKWFLVAALFLVGILFIFCIFPLLGVAISFSLFLINKAISPLADISYSVAGKEFLIPMAILIYPIFALLKKLIKMVKKSFE